MIGFTAIIATADNRSYRKHQLEEPDIDVAARRAIGACDQHEYVAGVFQTDVDLIFAAATNTLP